LTDKKRKSGIVGKRIDVSTKYGGNEPQIFRTRRDGTHYPIRGEVMPPIRNVEVERAMTRINERSRATQEFARRIADASSVPELADIQREIIASESLDQYDKDVLIDTVIDRKFAELMREAGRA
jgi:hypothetical protein